MLVVQTPRTRGFCYGEPLTHIVLNVYFLNKRSLIEAFKGHQVQVHITFKIFICMCVCVYVCVFTEITVGSNATVRNSRDTLCVFCLVA